MVMYVLSKFYGCTKPNLANFLRNQFFARIFLNYEKLAMIVLGISESITDLARSVGPNKIINT